MYNGFFYNKKIVRRTYPRCHWTKKKGKWKPKFPYCSKSAALEFIELRKLSDYEAYKCPICHKWHIGYHKRRVE